MHRPYTNMTVLLNLFKFAHSIGLATIATDIAHVTPNLQLPVTWIRENVSVNLDSRGIPATVLLGHIAAIRPSQIVTMNQTKYSAYVRQGLRALNMDASVGFLCNQQQYILVFFVRETFFKEIWIGLTDKKQFNCVEINHYYLHVHTDQARSKTQLRKIGERILLMQDRYAWYHHSFFPYLS